MKKVVFSGLALLTTIGIAAQELFKVHKPFIEQKLGNIIGQFHFRSVLFRNEGVEFLLLDGE